MNYKNNKGFVLKKGVRIAGWPFPPITNPGNISAVDKLRVLLSALNDGTCYWEIVPPDELAKLREEHGRNMRLGLVPLRQQRSDFGVSKAPSSKKRKAPSASTSGTRTGRATKKSRVCSEAFVPSDEDSDFDDSDEDSNEDEDELRRNIPDDEESDNYNEDSISDDEE